MRNGNCAGGLNFPINTVLCGAPMGGITFAHALSHHLNFRSIFAQKKVTAVATPASREESELIVTRYDIEAGTPMVIVDDVFHNGSTAGKLIDAIQKAGGETVAIACFLNRSLTVDRTFAHKDGKYPVTALVRQAILEYRQDDPAVADDIAAGNVIWKPKDEWEKLEAAMFRDYSV